MKHGTRGLRKPKNKTVRTGKNVNTFILRGGQGQPDVAVKVQPNNPTTNSTSVVSDFFYPSDKITTQPNSDPALKEAGIMHMTYASGINALRGVGTGIFNFFGARGFDTAIYDKARSEALKQLSDKMEENGVKRLCNLRMETDTSNPAMFVLNIYGTALK
jgi:uncharacterized protein YbjQ (UPF0145 family)